MKTNPIITLSNSGFNIANKVWSIPNTYSLTIQSNASGTASSDALIGTENYSTTLYAIPNEGYRLDTWNVTGGTVTNNIFTFGNTDAIVEPVFSVPTGPTPHTFTLMTAGGEYGWQLPIDVLLDSINNGLYIDISFYTNESDDTTWEGGFYMANPDNTSDYKRWVDMWNIRPEVVSPGYRECNVTNQMIVDGLTNSNISWLNALKNNGYTYVFTHPAAFQPNKFITEPTATFWYID